MRVAVALLTYGAPADLDEVEPYLARVRGGREPSPEVVAEFRERYRKIGGSPLVRITEAQAASLQRVLGDGFRVVAAMRYSEPTISRRVGELASFAPEAIVGVCLSPQWSALLMGGYEHDLREAAERELPRVPVLIAREWHREPAFLDALAERVGEALAERADESAIVLTAHSLPRRVFDAEPGFVAQLHETARLVAARAGLSNDQWRWAYQSAGHTQEEWLRPDLKELFPELAAAGHRRVLVVPVQFLADHLEVLYDLDIAAAAEARACGLEYARIAMPNTQPAFLRALAGVVMRELGAVARSPR
jgi:ferrochelatase